jgi:phosphotransferase system HPr (HPr) family protein
MRGSPSHARPEQPAPQDGRSPLSHESQDAMNGETLQQTVRVTNPDGLHMRPATAFAEQAKTFQSTVNVLKDGQSFNGKSPLDMLVLAAVEGTLLTLQVTGPDAPAALKKLVQLLQDNGVVDGPEPPLPKKG